jgi:hypothetical protein
LFWRSLIAIVAAMIAVCIVGFVIGFLMGALGADAETITLVTTPIGAVIGLALSIVPLRMILNNDFGECRLVICVDEGAGAAFGIDQGLALVRPVSLEPTRRGLLRTRVPTAA